MDQHAASREVHHFPRESTDSRPAPTPTKESATRGPAQPPLTRRLDTLLPPQKRYLGLRRRTFLILFPIVLLLIIGLALGLAIGLSRRSAPEPPAIPRPELGGSYFANATFYTPKYPDACGKGAGDPKVFRQTVAMSSLLWDALAARNETLCGRQIMVTHHQEFEKTGDPNMPTGGTWTSNFEVVDRCNTCGGRDLQFPKERLESGLFDLEKGEERAEVSWEWDTRKS